MRIEELLNIIDFIISSIHNICVRCRNVDKVIESRILNVLYDFLHLEVHCFRVKLDRSLDIGDGLTGIVEDSAEQ